MTPWLALGLGAILGSLCFFAWRARIRANQWEALFNQMHEIVEDLQVQLNQSIRNENMLLDLMNGLVNKPKPPEPWTGAFLPTDEAAAEMERQILSSEDRSISAGGLTPSSSRLTGRSASTSRPAT